MNPWIIISGLIFLIIIAIFITAYICFRIAFYAPPRIPLGDDAIDTPRGKIYDPYREKMEQWVRETRKLPKKEFTITSFDGLRLHGTYYEYAPGATVELMFHGYRGTAERDMSGGVQRCFKLDRSALIVDQRCSGRSEGKVISFGIRERKDCLSWIAFMREQFGPEVRVILTGISMGAATVMMAAGEELPDNVIGVLADCGYASPKAILKKVIRQMGIPVELGYFFVRLGAKLFGGFDPEEASPVEAMKKCKVPVIFFHGEEDALVPCEMSRECFDACTVKKRLVTIPGAGHGLCYPVDSERYLQELREFFAEGTV